jgi:hypothetical protein
MATFTFCKADPCDPRDLGFEIEGAGMRVADAYNCRVDIVDWSLDADSIPWVRVELHGAADIDAAGNWYFGELSRRGVVMMRE